MAITKSGEGLKREIGVWGIFLIKKWQARQFL